ncbi:hypothetical protein BC629DRAFT_1595549 [Irpex lacteus]|nr:hypothetical protein BC629DRAFT_1595549 [Irpex lacteus]
MDVYASRANENCAAVSLLPEILVQIWLCCRLPLESTFGNTTLRHNPKPQEWRDIALDTPILWNEVSLLALESGTFEHHCAFVQEYSKDVPLRLQAHLGGPSEQVKEFIFANIYRCEYLELIFFSDVARLKQALTQKPPLYLREVQLSHTHWHSPECLDAVLPYMTSLRSLTTVDFVFDASRTDFSSLTQLRICGPRVPHTMVLSILRHTHRLELLDLDGDFLGQGRETGPLVVHLPSLKSFCVREASDANGLVFLLQSCVFPPSTSIRLSMWTITDPLLLSQALRQKFAMEAGPSGQRFRRALLQVVQLLSSTLHRSMDLCLWTTLPQDDLPPSLTSDMPQLRISVISRNPDQNAFIRLCDAFTTLGLLSDIELVKVHLDESGRQVAGRDSEFQAGIPRTLAAMQNLRVLDMMVEDGWRLALALLDTRDRAYAFNQGSDMVRLWPFLERVNITFSAQSQVPQADILRMLVSVVRIRNAGDISDTIPITTASQLKEICFLDGTSKGPGGFLQGLARNPTYAKLRKMGVKIKQYDKDGIALQPMSDED